MPPPTPDEDAPVEVPSDIEQYAHDTIRTYISRHFKGHDFTRLVSAILEAQGYRVRQSPEGADGGVDIIAGRGPLGFDPPRLAVQVKSSDSPIDVKVLRELQGVMKNYGAEQGLVVAWGGYRGTVEKEAARLYFEIRLWDDSQVIQMLLEHYEKLSETIQAELPLKRIWTLIEEQAV